MIDFNSYINFIVLFFINRNQALNFVFKFKKKKKESINIKVIIINF